MIFLSSNRVHNGFKCAIVHSARRSSQGLFLLHLFGHNVIVLPMQQRLEVTRYRMLVPILIPLNIGTRYFFGIICGLPIPIQRLFEVHHTASIPMNNLIGM